MPIQIEPGAPWFIHTDKYSISKKLESFMDFYHYHESNYKRGYYDHLGYEFEEASRRNLYYNSILSYYSAISKGIEKKGTIGDYIWLNKESDLNNFNFTLSGYKRYSIFINESENSLEDLLEKYDLDYSKISGIYQLDNGFNRCKVLDFNDFIKNAIINQEGFVSFNNFKNSEIKIKDQCCWIGNECLAREGKTFGYFSSDTITICDSLGERIKLEGLNTLAEKTEEIYLSLMKDRNCKNCFVEASCPKCIKMPAEYCGIQKNNQFYISVLRFYVGNISIINAIMNRFNEDAIFFDIEEIDGKINYKIQDRADNFYYDKTAMKIYKYNKIETI